MTVNYEFFDNQTVGSARGIVSELRDGNRPLPTRGAPLCSFRQISRQIAGFFDDESAWAPDANGSGVPTERGVKLAVERGDTAPSYATTEDESSDGGLFAEPQKAPKSEQPAEPARTSRRRTRKGGSAESTAARATDQQAPSQDDAPLETAESDSAHPAEPGGEPGENPSKGN